MRGNELQRSVVPPKIALIHLDNNPSQRDADEPLEG